MRPQTQRLGLRLGIVAGAIAHAANNVSFCPNNVKRLGPTNRGGKRRGGEAKRHAKRTVWATEFPVWATENPVTLSVSPQMLIGRSLGRGVFRVFSKENSEDLTNKGGENKESATNCQKPKAPCLRYFRRRGGRWISRALSRLTDVKSGIAHLWKHEGWAMPTHASISHFHTGTTGMPSSVLSSS